MGTLNALINISPFNRILAVDEGVYGNYFLPRQLKGQPYAVGKLIASDDARQINSQMNYRLGYGGADARDDAGRAEQAGGGDGLDQVIRHLRVNGRHSRDVEYGDLCARADYALKQPLHHQLRAPAVE